jgi:hypothetical protein
VYRASECMCARAIILGAKVSTKRSNYRHKGRRAEAKSTCSSKAAVSAKCSSLSLLYYCACPAAKKCASLFFLSFFLFSFFFSSVLDGRFIFSRGLFSLPSNELSQFALLWPQASYYVSRQEIQNTPRYELYF